MDVTESDNTSTAADPQAIATSRSPKEHLAETDPTKTITPGEGARRAAVLWLGVLALVLLAVATIVLLAGR